MSRCQSGGEGGKVVRQAPVRSSPEIAAEELDGRDAGTRELGRAGFLPELSVVRGQTAEAEGRGVSMPHEGWGRSRWTEWGDD